MKTLDELRDEFKNKQSLIDSLNEECRKIKDNIYDKCEHYLLISCEAHKNFSGSYINDLFICASCGKKEIIQGLTYNKKLQEKHKIIKYLSHSEMFKYETHWLIKEEKYKEFEEKHKDHLNKMIIKEIIE